MTYTVWSRGQQIGETAFEIGNAALRKRIGRFQPTEFGLQVLPSITAMVPALVNFGVMCKERGIDPDTASPADAEHAFEMFGDTPEGQAVMAAASAIAELQVFDPNGRIVPWESLVIADWEWLEAHRSDNDELEPNGEESSRDPVKYMISLTEKRLGERHPEPWRRKMGMPSC